VKFNFFHLCFAASLLFAVEVTALYITPLLSITCDLNTAL